MFNDGGFCAFCQIQMVAIVRRVHLIARQPLGNVQQQQRFRWALVTLHLNVSDATRQAFGQVQKDFRLDSRR